MDQYNSKEILFNCEKVLSQYYHCYLNKLKPLPSFTFINNNSLNGHLKDTEDYNKSIKKINITVLQMKYIAVKTTNQY